MKLESVSNGTTLQRQHIAGWIGRRRSPNGRTDLLRLAPSFGFSCRIRPSTPGCLLAEYFQCVGRYVLAQSRSLAAEPIVLSGRHRNGRNGAKPKPIGHGHSRIVDAVSSRPVRGGDKHVGHHDAARLQRKAGAGSVPPPHTPPPSVGPAARSASSPRLRHANRCFFLRQGLHKNASFSTGFSKPYGSA